MFVTRSLNGFLRTAQPCHASTQPRQSTLSLPGAMTSCFSCLLKPPAPFSPSLFSAIDLASYLTEKREAIGRQRLPCATTSVNLLPLARLCLVSCCSRVWTAVPVYELGLLPLKARPCTCTLDPIPSHLLLAYALNSAPSHIKRHPIYCSVCVQMLSFLAFLEHTPIQLLPPLKLLEEVICIHWPYFLSFEPTLKGSPPQPPGHWNHGQHHQNLHRVPSCGHFTALTSEIFNHPLLSEMFSLVWFLEHSTLLGFLLHHCLFCLSLISWISSLYLTWVLDGPKVLSWGSSALHAHVSFHQNCGSPMHDTTSSWNSNMDGSHTQETRSTHREW